jgi:peptide deformylase
MEVIHYPNPVLKKRAVPLSPQNLSDSTRKRIQEMFEIMYVQKGVGLAAPQVAWSVRLFVVNPGGEEDRSRERVYINPEIVLREGEVVDEEGCLSIPGVRGKVARSERVVVRALDLDGKPFEEDARDLEARAIQHELDHLDGILFITRLSAMERLQAGKALKKLEKEYKESLPAKRPSPARR